MGKRREKTRWSQVDWIHSRRGGKLKRNSAVGPRFVKQPSNVVEQNIISEFCSVEDLPDGFTKIRSKNLDIIFKRDFYENKMMIPPGFYPDGELMMAPTAEVTACQSSVTFDQLDLDEIPEFRPRDGSFNASICNDSGYSSSFQEVFPEQLHYSLPPPPPPPPTQYLPYQVSMPHPQPAAQFYLYSPGANTLIPCEEIILSKTILSPDGPVYESPTKAYVAYPVQGPDGHGYITQPFTGPEILSSPEPGQVQEESPANFKKTLAGTGGRKTQPRSKRTPPGIKQLPTDAPPVTNYIPGLPLQSLKTKKRRKKKAKSKLSEDLSKVSLSSSDSEAREACKGNEGSESNIDLFDFEQVEAEPMNEITLTDDLTNSLVNPPTEDDDIENSKIAEDLINLIETEKVCEVPTNVHCSYSEIVRKSSIKENVLKASFEDSKIPTESGAHIPPVKLSTILVSKSKTKSRKKKPKVKMEEVIEPFIQDNEIENEEKPIESKSFCEEIEETPIEAVSETLESNDVHSKVVEQEEDEEDVAEPAVPEAEVPANEAGSSSTGDRSMRPRKNKKRRGKERSVQQQRVLVVDDQVDIRYCQVSEGAVTEIEGGQAVSSNDVLFIKDLGHGMARGVMDMERPFMGSYVPPEREYQEISHSNVGESQSEENQVLKTDELLLLD